MDTDQKMQCRLQYKKSLRIVYRIKNICKMFNEKYTNVLKFHSNENEDDEEKQQSKLVLNIKDKEIVINSFEDVGAQIPEQIISKYQPQAILHQSVNSIIIKCKCRQSLQKKALNNENYQVIIKITPMTQFQAQILKTLKEKSKSKHIVSLVDQIDNCLILQSYRGSLRDILCNNEQISIKIILKILRDCLQALISLQQIDLIHGDIKPENILYQGESVETIQFLLADFGSCIPLYQSQQLKICRQTWTYQAPQWIEKGIKIDSKIDVWGLGCVLFQCITGQSLLPLEIQNVSEYKKAIQIHSNQQNINLRLQRHSYASQINLFHNILISMLQVNPEKRINLMEASQMVQEIQQ